MTIRPRDRIALGGVAAVAALAAFYLLVLAPAQHRAASLTKAIAGQRQALVQAQDHYAAGRAAQALLRRDAGQRAALARAVPDTSDIPALLRVLERNADAVHVNMQAIALSGGSASGATGTAAPPTSPGASATGTGGATSSGGATSVPVSLTFAGGYQALNRLVAHLDGLVAVSGDRVRAAGPLLSIGNVSLNGSGSSKLTVQLTATIYQRAAATSGAATTTGGA